MGSRAFGFVAFVFILALILVGWYMMEGLTIYDNSVVGAMTNNPESLLEPKKKVVPVRQDFFSWLETKISIASQAVEQKVKELIK